MAMLRQDIVHYRSSTGLGVTAVQKDSTSCAPTCAGCSASAQPVYLRQPLNFQALPAAACCGVGALRCLRHRLHCLTSSCCAFVQLHAAVVELSAAKDAQIKYSTVQNWYPGDAEGKGGIYNFVTKRALCHGANSKVSWTQVSRLCWGSVGAEMADVCRGAWKSKPLHASPAGLTRCACALSGGQGKLGSTLRLASEVQSMLPPEEKC